MTNVLKSRKDGWEALKAGTYVNDYADALSKDTRTSLQKAIDKHEPFVRVHRKKWIEDGDLQMLTPDGWEQFCIHKAKKFVNDQGLMVLTRQRVSGIWYNHNRSDIRLFNEGLDEREDKSTFRNVKGEIVDLDKEFPRTKKPEMDLNDDYKMMRQEREQYSSEGFRRTNGGWR